MKKQPEKRQVFPQWMVMTVILAVTTVIYAPTLRHSFTNWDDNDYVTENPLITDINAATLSEILTRPVALNYHPLTILSLSLNYQVSGYEPWSYFAFNILLHLMSTLLTFFFVRQIPGCSRVLAWFAAAVFALHPMHVESVAWVSERKDVLYAFFFLAALVTWPRWAADGRMRWYPATLVLFLLSALSKPTAVVFPAVMFLLDYLHHRRLSVRTLAEKIPFLAVSVWIGIATLHAQVGRSVVDPVHFNLVQQVLFASYGFFVYIVKFFMPSGLSAFHPVPLFNTSLDLPPLYFVAPVASLVIIAAVVLSLRQTRMVLFGMLFFFFSIALTLQFFQVGSAVMAERYTYLAYTGLVVAVGWPLMKAMSASGKAQGWIYAAMIVFTVMLAVLSFRRVTVWENSGTLWSDVIRQYPQSATAYNNRGYYHVQQKLYDAALADFSKALEIRPGFVDALNNRASLHRLQEQHRPAVADYNLALAIDPGHLKAITGRGNSYMALGLLDSAKLDYDRAYAIDSVMAAALSDRGGLWFRLGLFEQAIAESNRKLAADPGNTATLLNRGASFSSLGRWEEAIRDYSTVIDAGTSNPNVFEWRGVAWLNTGHYREAVADFTAGIGLAPGRISLYLNRATAYGKAGDAARAGEDLQTATRLSQSQAGR